MEKRQKVYVCKRLRVLNYLTLHGFKYDYVIPDAHDPELLNWVFPRCEELTKALDAFYDSEAQIRNTEV